MRICILLVLLIIYFKCNSGHILLSLPQEKKRFTELNSGRWQEKIYKLMFAVHIQGKPDLVKSSYFMNENCFTDLQEQMPSVRDIAQHDICEYIVIN